MSVTWMKHVLMDKATDGSQGGAPGTNTPAAQGAAHAGQAGAAAGASGSALAAGQAEAGSAASAQGGAGAGPYDWIPEKYRVTKADGALDIEASARKVAEAYRHLEQKLGAGDVPPKTPEDYELKGLPESVKIEDIKADPEMQSFLKAAHAKGMTNEQVSFVLNEYLARAPKLVENGRKLTAEEATATLREVWADESSYRKNMGYAYRAASAIADKAGISFAELEQSGLGDHPLFIRLMASIGPELSEDVVPTGANSISPADWDSQVAALRAHPAYIDPKHPEHKQVMAKMEALYQKRYGTKPQKLFSGVGH